MTLRRTSATTAQVSVTASRTRHTQRLNALVVVAALLIGLGGCATSPIVTPRDETSPVSVSCDASCLTSCVHSLPRWTGAPDDPRTWDALGDVVGNLLATIAVCDAARSACVQCLRRLDAAGVTCGTATPCAGGAP